MRTAYLALVALPAAASAQTLSLPIPVRPTVIAPNVLRPNMVALPPCLSGAVIGEEGSGEIVGEKGSKTFGNRWSASGFTSYKHVLVGPPGRRTLSLYGCSSAGGGETVAVYLTGADGERKTGWRHFVIATRNGNSRAGSVTLPQPAQGQALSRLPIVVVVENASGRPHVGEYRLKLVE